MFPVSLGYTCLFNFQVQIKTKQDTEHEGDVSIFRSGTEHSRIRFKLSNDMEAQLSVVNAFNVKAEYYFSLFSFLTREEEQAACLLPVLAEKQDITQRP